MDLLDALATLALVAFVAWGMVVDLRAKLGQRVALRSRSVRSFVPRRWPERFMLFAAVVALLAELLLLPTGRSGAIAYVLAGALTVILIAGAFALMRVARHARRIEDTPSSRIRSAAQGYVEIQGVAAPAGRQTQCPACRVECIWWSLVDLDGERHAGEVPFMVEDGPDRCLVDPNGAEWIITSSTCPGLASEYSSGAHVLAGDVLYLLGEFGTSHSGRPDPSRMDARAASIAAERIHEAMSTPHGLAAIDTDTDGVLSVAERQAFAARVKAQVVAERAPVSWRAETHVMRRPPDGRPFMIATTAQAAAIGHLRRRVLLGAGGLLAVAGALAATLVRI